jgi:predicted MFS family arabinose efflux permease
LLVLTPRPLVPLVFAVLGVLISLNNTSFPEYMIERFTEEGSGRVMGLISTNFYVANVGMAVFGSLLSLAGSRWSLLAGSLLCTAAWLWLRRVTHPPVEVPPGARAS